MSRQKEKHSFGPVRAVILIAALCVLCWSGWQLYSIFSVYKKAGDEYNALADDFTRPYAAEAENSGTPASGASSAENVQTGAVSAGTEMSPAAAAPVPQAGMILDGEARKRKKEVRVSGTVSPAADLNTASSAETAAEQSPKPAAEVPPESSPEPAAASPPESSPEQVLSPTPELSPEPTPEPEICEDAEPPLEVDWNELKAINPDIVGWIYVDALPTINYPVLKGEDNEYYLHHTSGANIFLPDLYLRILIIPPISAIRIHLFTVITCGTEVCSTS